MDKKVFLYILIIMITLSQSVFADMNMNQYKREDSLNDINKLQSYVLFVPAGTKVNAILAQEINFKTAVLGQTINAILTEDFRYKNYLVAAAGSIVCGNIVFDKSILADESKQMHIKFTTIRTPYNNIIPISAVVKADTIENSVVMPREYSMDSNDEIDSSESEDLLTPKNRIFIPSNSKVSIVLNQPITLGAP